jgi:hypothetical protein
MTRFEKVLTWSSTVAVAGTGLVYAWMKYMMVPADEWAVVNHPLQPIVLKLHILAGPFLIFAIGMLAARHILPQLRAGVRRARISGTSAALVIVPMVITGYLIQAVTHAGLLAVLGWVHLGAGVLYAIFSAAHALAARRRAAAATRSDSDTLTAGLARTRLPPRYAAQSSVRSDGPVAVRSKTSTSTRRPDMATTRNVPPSA